MRIRTTTVAQSASWTLALAAGTLALPMLAHGAEGAGVGVEEVIVTARKRAESMQDTPISMSAFTADDIEARGLPDLASLGEVTPNLVFDFADANNGSSNTAIINIRGIGASDFALTVDPGVGLYVDGVYMARSVGAVLDLVDFERVEVLRGPQGTLFGKNTIGGAINITTRKPTTDAFSGKAELITGSYNRFDARATINVPLSSTLAAGAAISNKSRDGYVENLAPGGVDLGDEGRKAARVALRWTPSDAFSIDLSADYERMREGPAANVTMAIDENPPTFAWLYNLAFSGDPSCADTTNPARLSNPLCFNQQWIPNDPYQTYKTYVPVPIVSAALAQVPGGAELTLSPHADLDQWGAGLTAEWQISASLTAKSITAYRTAENGHWSRTMSAPNIPYAQTVATWDQKQFSQEFQLLGTAFDDRLKWIGGFYMLEEEGRHFEVAIITGIVLTTDNFVDNSSKALFGQATYDFTDRASLTLGARYSDEKKKYTPDSLVFADLGLGVPAGTRLVPFETATATANEVTPYANFSYRWNTDLMTYVSYSEGFKGGGFTQRVFPPRREIPSFKPEFATTYEMGFKSTLGDRRARLNGAIFYTDYQDLQINIAAMTGYVTGLGAVGVITANAAKAEIYGAELELLLLPADQWQIEAGLGYLHSEYKEIDSSAVALSQNNKLVNAPKLSFNAGIQYEGRLGDYGTLRPRMDYSYTAKTYNDPENNPLLVQEGYGLVNASLTWEDDHEHWSVVAAGKNLTDEIYIVDGVNDAGNGFIDGTFGMPRTWSLTLGRRF